jgi:hypothetical protein
MTHFVEVLIVRDLPQQLPVILVRLDAVQEGLVADFARLILCLFGLVHILLV